MNKNKFWSILLTLTFCYQAGFLFSYITEQLVKLHSVAATTYWISAGLLGILIGSYLLFKVDTAILGKILAFVVTLFGMGLIGLWLLAFVITSM